MSVEYKYSPVEGTVTIDNKLEIDEEKSNGKSTSEIADMTVERDISDAISNGKSFLYIAACIGNVDNKLDNGDEVANGKHTTENIDETLELNDNDKVSANRNFLYIAAAIANLATFGCGITFGWTSSELLKLQDNATTPLPYPATITQSAWIGSLVPLGASVGPFVAGISADVIGRKKTLLIAGMIVGITFAGLAWAKQILVFYILRFVCGLAVGFIYTVLPMYIAEISDDSVRGALGSLMQLFVMSGLLYAYTIGPYVGVVAFNLMCVIPSILFLVLFFILIPESPYFLLAKNKDEKATKALSKFRGTSNIEKELEQMKQSIEDAKANKGSFLDLFKTKAYVKAMIICVGLAFFQQFTGINIVLFYTYEVTGNSLRQDIATIIVGIMQVVFSCISPILVERKGKRFLLLTSAIGMTIALGGLGYFFRMKDIGSSTDSISWLPILSLVIFNATYCSGFGPLPWAILGELFPTNVKFAASTLTAAISWFLGFITTRYFSVAEVSLGKGISFFIFSLCCVLAALFVYKMVPETSGKSLQEIQDILEGKSVETDIELKEKLPINAEVKDGNTDN